MTKAIGTVALILASFAALAFADDKGVAGQLADAACKQKTPEAACPVSAATAAFGVQSAGGGFAPFDDAGNRKAAEEVRKSRAQGNPAVVVTGAFDGKILRVESIELR